MGAICPYGCGYQPIQANITASGEPAFRASEVIAQRLRCGHVIGGEEYEEFMQSVKEIDREAYEKIQEIEKEARQKKAALAKEIFQKEDE